MILKGKLKYWVLIIIISMGIGFVFAKVANSKKVSKTKSELTIDNLIIENKIEEDVLETSFEDDRIEPDTKLILKKKFIDCKHTISKEVELPGELINLSLEELKLKYPEWKIEEFDDDLVVLYKEVSGICTEHFIIKTGDDFIEVYSLDEKYDTKLYEITNTSIEYLTEDDLEKLEEGIYVYGLQELNSTLENFE